MSTQSLVGDLITSQTPSLRITDDITETNEFIDDSDTIRETLLSQQEIEELRAQGVSAEEMIRRQIERHESFGLKTDFSKEKWRKRKEKK